jgi:hypothetical protein
MGNTRGRVAGERFLYGKDDLEESASPGKVRNEEEAA